MTQNQRKIGAILAYTSQAVMILSGLVYTPIMLRLLGQSEYGLYTLVNSVISYLSLLSLGFTSAYIRYYAKAKHSNEKQAEARLNGMFIIIFSIMAVLSIACGIVMLINARGVFGNGLTEKELSTARILMTFMIANMAMSFIASVYTCIITAHEKFVVQQMINLLQSLLNPFLTLPLLIMGYGSIGMVIISTFLTIGKLLVSIYYCKRKLNAPFLFSGLSFSIFRDMWGFTFFIFLNQIIDQVNWSVDKFLLGRFAGTTAVAIYGVGGTINTMYLQLSNAISYVFVPEVNNIVARNGKDEELSNIFIKVGRIQFAIVMLVLTGFVFLGKPFMTIWGGKEYSESYYVALFLLVPVTIPLIQNIGIEIQRAKNKHKIRSIVYLLIAIANVGISIPLIKKWGAVGAASGTAIALLVGNILFMNWYYQSRIGINILSFWKSIVSFAGAFIAPLIIGIIMMKCISVSTFYQLILCIGVYTTIYCVSMWFFGLNTYEKELARSIAVKIVRRGK